MSDQVLCERCAKAIEDRSELCVRGLPSIESASLHKDCYIEMRVANDPAHRSVIYIEGEKGVTYFARLLENSKFDFYSIFVISALIAFIIDIFLSDPTNRFNEAASKSILIVVVIALAYVPPLRKRILDPFVNFIHRQLLDLIYMKYWKKIPKSEI